MGARALLLAGLLAVTGAAGSAQTARRRRLPTIPSPGSRSSKRAGAGLGAARECAHPRRAPGRSPLPAHLRRGADHPPGARPHPRRPDPPRRPLQFLAGRRSCSRHPARAPRSPATAPTKPQWETVLDVDALAPAEGKPTGSIRACNACRPRSGCCLVSLSDGGRDANVCASSTSDATVRRGRLHPAGGQAEHRLGRRGHDPGRARMGAGDDDPAPAIPSSSSGCAAASRSTRPKRCSAARPRTCATASAFALREPMAGSHAIGVEARLDFFRTPDHLSRPGGNGRPWPSRSQVALAGIVDGRLLVTLDEPWEAAQETAFRDQLARLLRPRRNGSAIRSTPRPSLVWAPGPRARRSSGVATTHDASCSSTSSTMSAAAPSLMIYADGAWRSRPIALPHNATIGLTAAVRPERAGDVQRHRLS